ncbi:epsin-3-like isoform X1 [Sinocyclocheilus anshuiensis]|uniref:Epsin-3-like n=1 Tax=Sinocyclocheilus anshuiensis TaxID=1608454 RepID=A0A671M3Y9_9TELE|nr:PREDICTED: epsin-3-like isoform X1 [Sinocyclocheilus anshuiensis]XP_016318835.1 PREDICTED: epsin-3-like isoform X1 [Sinocyclocheilus anshuiensis]
MTTSSLRRQMKNIVNNYTDAEIKVREATSNDPWGPPTSLLMEIADLTFNVVALTEVMGIIWKRLNDHGKNWRHVYKALTLLDYLIKSGSERVAQQCKENIYAIQTLRDFQYIDRDGQDQGMGIREKSKQLVALLRDDEQLKQERSQAHKTRERVTGTSSAMGYGSLPPPYPGRHTIQPSVEVLYGEEHGRVRHSPSSVNSSSSSSHLAPDMERARPQTSGEEELQLQLALAMSREESEKPVPAVDIDEQTQLQIAMSLSEEEAHKPAPPPAAVLDMDEEAQLQLALTISKEEHQQEEQSRQGDESLLQKALEESKRELEAKGGRSAMLDLADIFAPAPDVPSAASSWDSSGGHSGLAQAGPLRSDPWDSLEPSSLSRQHGSSWMAPPASSVPSQPWVQRQPHPDPWDAPQNAPSPVSMNQTWISPARGTGVDPFSPLEVDKQGSIGPLKTPSPRAGSPSDDDLFDEAMDGGQANINGHSSPEPFDMSSLGEGLPKTAPRTCSTPEAFLGPTGASLVNLDSLIPSNPPSKNFNPFLSGIAAPSASNPFQHEPPHLTLNQMRPSSTSPVPTSLPFNASLPMAASNQSSFLPTTFTQSAQVPGNLPQPLLPLSTTSTLGDPDQHNQNPFL